MFLDRLLQLVRRVHHQERFGCTTVHHRHLPHRVDMALLPRGAGLRLLPRTVQVAAAGWVRVPRGRHTGLQRDRSHQMVRHGPVHEGTDWYP